MLVDFHRLINLFSSYYCIDQQKRVTPSSSATNNLTRDRPGSGNTKRPTEVVIPHDVTIESRSVRQVNRIRADMITLFKS